MTRALSALQGLPRSPRTAFFHGYRDNTATMQGNAVSAVFANVLPRELGLPVPVEPTLLAGGRLAMSLGRAGRLLAAAPLASVFAEFHWFAAGRAIGYRVLSGLCKLFLNPGSCISSAEPLFMRWGARSRSNIVAAE